MVENKTCSLQFQTRLLININLILIELKKCQHFRKLNIKIIDQLQNFSNFSVFQQKQKIIMTYDFYLLLGR